MRRAIERQRRVRNFHVPLSEPLYKALQSEARRSGHPATEIARNAIRAVLTERAKSDLYDELRAYAERNGGTGVDLDPDLEAAGIDSILLNVPR